ncbi:PAS domain-containing hybrid sensor histidine kinase/response regulator [Hymenobacter cavernae]|uniref:histidine kinase n=1 Tax=Hymenobacter cavernae TaxID=2044852 RepID=A0ABQ1U6N3_9BACT|nr:PAS domain-containing hybrid sensor histidine kinase/response regulator [Hymenobacter cavernae]GGF11933.1 hypothetical protein GCM10011383_23960 [Hymenobacter cavernae]
MEDNATLTAELARLLEIVAQQEQEIQTLRARLESPNRVQAALPCLPEVGNLEQLLFLVEKLFTAVVLTDLQGNYLWINEGVAKLWGYKEADLASLPRKSILDGNFLDSATAAYIQECRAQSLPYEFEIPNSEPSSGTGWIRIKAQPLLNKQRQAVLYATMIEDITERKTAQLALIDNEQRFRTLIESAPGALYEWRENLDGTYYATYGTPKFKELFGITAADVPLIPSFIHPEDRARWRQSIEESKRLRSPWQFEGRMVVPGQPLRWWRADAILAEEDEDGVLYRGIMNDTTAAVLAQQTIRESDQRWRAAMEGVGNDTWEYNLQTKELIISAKYRDLLGYDNRQHPTTGCPWYANVRAQDLAAASEALARVVGGEVPLYSVTYQIVDQPGPDKWILSRAMITQRDEAGKPLILTGTHTDVTEVTEAKMALEASTLRLVSTIASLQGAVLLEDEHQKIVLANEAFCRLFGLVGSPDELIGADCLTLAEEAKPVFSDEAGFIQRINTIRQQRQAVREDTIVLKDGRVLSRDSTPIFVHDHYIGFLWKYEDVTVRKNEEEVLRRREEKYRGILENLNLGLVEIDREGKVLFANNSYGEMTGYSVEELLGDTLDKLFAQNPESKQLIEKKKKLRPLGISDSYELAIETKQGQVKWLMVSGAPLYNDEKQHVGSIGVHLDITQQKRLQTSLREAKEVAEESAKAKERFLANMSHEIRTPMNAILGMSQLLNKTPLSAQQDNYLRAITTSAESLLVIINDILDQSKIDAGKMTIEHIGFSLRNVFEQVEKTLQYKAEDKGLSLLMQVGAGIPEVLIGDPHRITQVLLNLAGNSIKFTEKGQVRVSCKLAGTLEQKVVVEFKVRDTGIGMDQQYLGSLFQSFSQEDSSISRKFGGTGLGLHISRNLVDLMGGEIQIESEKHQGTTSTFALQLSIGSGADLPRTELTGSLNTIREELRGKRVLLVEDNEFNRMLAKTLLEQAHIQVAEAENGAIAVAMARQQAFDLILMDMHMPVMNGLEATSQLRQELGLQTPIIALTANAIQGDNQKCLTAGMNDYLSKPFREDQLLKMVHDWLPRAPAPAPGDLGAPLYRPDLLQEMAGNDHKFVGFMLRTFLKSSEEVLASIRAGFAAGNVATLQEAAHQIRPSLTHMQMQQVLEPVKQLENWTGPFEQATLQQLVDLIEKLLRQAMTQMEQDLKNYQ